MEELESLMLLEFRSNLPLAERLMRAERALLGRLGVTCSRELPLSVVELLYLRQELRQEVDGWLEEVEEVQQVEEVHQVEVAGPAVDVERLVQHTADLLVALAEEHRELPLLLRFFGLERKLLEAHGVKVFADFGLEQREFKDFVLSKQVALAPRLPKTGLQVARRLKMLGQEALEEHFVGLDVPMEELESSEEVARELQVLLARSGWSPLRPPRLELARVDLAREAARRIAEAPLLVDLLEAVPWAEFRALGTIFDFLGSQELHGGLPLGVVEVRCGQLLRLGPADAGALDQALAARDPRGTAAALLARCLAETRPPWQQFEAALQRFFATATAPEAFLLGCISALPREARDLVAPLVAKGYWPLRRPERLAAVARKAPELTVAARWLGRRYGLLELAELPWREHYEVDEVDEVTPRPVDLPPVAVDLPVAAAPALRVAPPRERDVSNEALCKDIARRLDMWVPSFWEPSPSVFPSFLHHFAAIFKVFSWVLEGFL